MAVGLDDDGYESGDDESYIKGRHMLDWALTDRVRAQMTMIWRQQVSGKCHQVLIAQPRVWIGHVRVMGWATMRPRMHVVGSIPKNIRARRLVLESCLQLVATDPSSLDVLCRTCAEAM